MRLGAAAFDADSRGHNGHASRSFGFARVRSHLRMTCKYGLSANGRERARTLPTLAMQKVVGSSPIIRFKKPPADLDVLSSVLETVARAWSHRSDSPVTSERQRGLSEEISGRGSSARRRVTSTSSHHSDTGLVTAVPRVCHWARSCQARGRRVTVDGGRGGPPLAEPASGLSASAADDLREVVRSQLGRAALLSARRRGWLLRRARRRFLAEYGERVQQFDRCASRAQLRGRPEREAAVRVAGAWSSFGTVRLQKERLHALSSIPRP